MKHLLAVSVFSNVVENTRRPNQVVLIGLENTLMMPVAW